MRVQTKVVHVDHARVGTNVSASASPFSPFPVAFSNLNGNLVDGRTTVSEELPVDLNGASRGVEDNNLRCYGDISQSNNFSFRSHRASTVVASKDEARVFTGTSLEVNSSSLRKLSGGP